GAAGGDGVKVDALGLGGADGGHHLPGAVVVVRSVGDPEGHPGHRAGAPVQLVHVGQGPLGGLGVVTAAVGGQVLERSLVGFEVGGEVEGLGDVGVLVVAVGHHGPLLAQVG